MSWTKGARIEYPPNLRIQEDSRAVVEFSTEPRNRNFGKKTLRDGREVDDIRYFARVKYIEGTARSKKGDGDSIAAVSGEEYTLWLSTTLSTAIAKAAGWKEGDSTPALTGTKWEIWRSNERIGGNRIYAARHVSGDIIALSDVPPSDDDDDDDNDDGNEIAIKNPTNNKTVLTDMELDATALQLSKAIEPLGEIEVNTWNKYCGKKGYDGELLTQRMVALDLVEINGDVIKYKG